MKKLVLLFNLIFCLSLFSQNNNCGISYSKNYKDLRLVNAEKVKCIARQNKGQSLFVTFGIGCKPCREDIKQEYEFAKEHGLDFYVVMLEEDIPEDRHMIRGIDFLKKIDSNINILNIDGIEYKGKFLRKFIDIRKSSSQKAYKQFVNDIVKGTSFKNINDLSKKILINNHGQVQMVSSGEDYQNADGTYLSETEFLNKKLLPLIKN